MKLHEITDEHSPMMKWVLQNTYTDSSSGPRPPPSDWIDERDDGVIINTEAEGLYVSCGQKLNPPGKIRYCDTITYQDGTMENLLPAMVTKAHELSFTNITGINADMLVDVLLGVKAPLLSWSDCMFDGSIVPLVRLSEILANTADECGFSIDDDLERAELLEELVKRGWSERMDEFDFQQLLIENGFEELT